MTKPAPIIRDATAADEAAWHRLWDQYLAFYKVELADDVTAHTWARILEPSSRVAMRVAEVEGTLAGFAIHHFHDSTWVKTPDCYLEDLYVAPDNRGGRVARALIEAVYAEADARGAERVYWHTQEFNAPARSLYDTLARRTSFIVYRR